MRSDLPEMRANSGAEFCLNFGAGEPRNCGGTGMLTPSSTSSKTAQGMGALAGNFDAGRTKNRWPEAERFRHFEERGSGERRNGCWKVFAPCRCQKSKTPSLSLRLRSVVECVTRRKRLILHDPRATRFYRYTKVLPVEPGAGRSRHSHLCAGFTDKQALTRVRFYPYTPSSTGVTTHRAVRNKKEAR